MNDPDTAPDVVPDVGPDVVPDVGPDVAPDAAPAPPPDALSLEPAAPAPPPAEPPYIEGPSTPAQKAHWRAHRAAECRPSERWSGRTVYTSLRGEAKRAASADGTRHGAKPRAQLKPSQRRKAKRAAAWAAALAAAREGLVARTAPAEVTPESTTPEPCIPESTTNPVHAPVTE